MLVIQITDKPKGLSAAITGKGSDDAERIALEALKLIRRLIAEKKAQIREPEARG